MCYITDMKIKIGAHLSISGGYANPLKKIKEIGGNTLQIFSTSPRGWSFAKPSEAEVAEFKELKKEFDIDPIYFHASYLINLGNHERGGEISKNSLKHELKLAAKMGVKGSIVHLGSFKNHDEKVAPADIKQQEHFQTLVDNIKDILKDSPEESLFMIENAGNRKIGRTIEEIATIIKSVNNNRLRVCLDTCHLHAAGYDISTIEKLDEFLAVFDKLIGLKKLELWHLNDSRDPFGSLRDRHDNIGEGMIGADVFRIIINHDKLKNIPFIIETPGFDDNGPDKKNIDILKSLIQE